MTHYVCTGDCGNQSDKPGVCHTADCNREGEALVACSCEDGLHEEALETPETKE